MFGNVFITTSIMNMMMHDNDDDDDDYHFNYCFKESKKALLRIAEILLKLILHFPE